MTALEEKKTAVSVNGLRVNNLRFADDIDLLETNRDTLQENLELLKGDAEKAGLKINIGKTKTMVFGKESLANKVEIDGMQIDNVNEFVYLGSLLTWDNDCSKEMKRRLDKAIGAMAGFSTIWKSRHVSIQVKLKLLYVYVFSVLLYASETWTLKKLDKDRLLAFEMKCYRWILRIQWQQKVRNEEVKRRIGANRNVFQIIHNTEKTPILWPHLPD